MNDLAIVISVFTFAIIFALISVIGSAWIDRAPEEKPRA